MFCIALLILMKFDGIRFFAVVSPGKRRYEVGYIKNEVGYFRWIDIFELLMRQLKIPDKLCTTN